MPSRITVLPASTQAGRHTIQFLLQSESKPFVRGIYRDATKAPVEFTSLPNFQAVQGDIATGKGLDFTNSDAVLYIPPPTWDGTDQAEFAHKTANFVANALKKSRSIKRLGTLKLNNIADNILRDAAPEVIIVRPGYYFHVWQEALNTMQEDPPRFESPFSPGDWKVPMLSTKDIGQYCAETLHADAIDPRQRDIRLFGPQHYSPLDVKDALEAVTGRKGDMILVPEAGLAQYWGKQIPEVYLPEFVKFIKAQLPGGVMAQDYEDGKDTVRCHTSLQEELREMLAQHE
ncbi:hypothetical protein CGCSCA1_v006806 [Colletotrichum siamense]|nr:hypothetical protein CGCSCA1_v006806 [Colletotrichum siamense]